MKMENSGWGTVSLIIQDVSPLPVARNMGLLPWDFILNREIAPDDDYFAEDRNLLRPL
jgi:hypothetical protein